jgi:MFS family permease
MSFRSFLREGLEVFQRDPRFRLFVVARWLDGTAMMALPFYVIAATEAGIATTDVAMLLGAQTIGALVSNPVWGWWGDRVGKRSLLGATALVALVAPLLTLLWLSTATVIPDTSLAWFAAMFLILGAVGNGSNIAHLGYLWEISPDARRPAYSGYFNAFAAPAALSPILGAVVIEAAGLPVVFAASALAAVAQCLAVRRLRHAEEKAAFPCP